jgi:hypothetical protein
MAARTDPAQWSDLQEAFDGLMAAAQSRNEQAVIEGLMGLEPGFHPDPRKP